ncbi:MAG: diguanylate cyclase domain-containing protein, partial [Acidovorax sp.]|uniref:diguanylate cyclase domain-containing protein n=1 Tax=Acidovorax sp. TaxID=1872122 RepID=UPI00391A0D85
GVTYLNPVAERLTGWQAFDAAGHNVDEVVSLRSADNDDLLASPLRAAIQQAAVVDVVRGVVVHRRSGQRFQVEETASPITDRHGAVTGAVAVLRDVTEAAAMAERMAHLAQYDALTDLPNRVLLQDRAQLAISQARRDGKSLAVMYLDLDGFKAVNDSLGHDVGDQLLVQFAQRLQAAVRASDTVCRQGGDEFVVLLPGLDGAEAACGVARKILASCDAPFHLAGEMLHVGLSGGIALYPQHGDTFDALSRHADSAMYAAKRGGRMRFMLYVGQGAEPTVVLAGTVVVTAK